MSFFPYLLLLTKLTDLIFLLVTIIATLPGVLFNKYLPLIDVITNSCTAKLAN